MIFRFITDQLIMFDNYLYNYIVMGIIGLIAYKIAFGAIGKLYDNGFIAGSRIGRTLHWIIRFFVFMALFLVASVAIWLVKAIMSIPIHVWFIVLGILFLGFLAYFILKMWSHSNNNTE